MPPSTPSSAGELGLVAGLLSVVLGSVVLLTGVPLDEHLAALGVLALGVLVVGVFALAFVGGGPSVERRIR